MSEVEKTVRTKTGRVVSNKMQQTIAVEIVRKVRHPHLGKYVKRITKLLVHDEQNQCKEGDTVVIKECRPLSKRKAWTLVEILTSAA